MFHSTDIFSSATCVNLTLVFLELLFLHTFKNFKNSIWNFYVFNVTGLLNTYSYFRCEVGSVLLWNPHVITHKSPFGILSCVKGRVRYPTLCLSNPTTTTTRTSTVLTTSTTTSGNSSLRIWSENTKGPFQGYSNNTWHFFGTFLTPRETFSFFKSLIFRPKLL